MHSIHRTVIAAIIGLAAVAGVVGLTRTLDLGASSQATATVSPAVIAKRTKKLDRFEASLRKARNSRPPALPPLPEYPSVATSSPAPTQAPTQAVTYVRPPPRVVVVPRSGGEHDDHHEGSEEWDD